jgi:F-type H+-transporting ATPase subunit b
MAEFLILSVAPNLTEVVEMEGQPHTGAEAVETAHGGVGAANHPDPSALGLDGTGWVSLAMAAFLAIVLLKGGWGMITGLLDKQIAGIRHQLDEAKALRAEAEALRDEYARKIADAEANAAEMTRHAEAESAAIVEQARKDADELVARRAKMAEDKIAAAERTAVAEVRAKAAAVASAAAETLIAQRHGAEADRALVSRTISGLGRLN